MKYNRTSIGEIGTMFARMVSADRSITGKLTDDS